MSSEQKCPNCGATIPIDPNDTRVQCPNCNEVYDIEVEENGADPADANYSHKKSINPEEERTTPQYKNTNRQDASKKANESATKGWTRTIVVILGILTIVNIGLLLIHTDWIRGPATAQESSTSFEAVTDDLDRGGNLYGYVSSQQLGENILEIIDEVSNTNVTTLRNNNRDQAAARSEKWFDLSEKVVKQIGLTELSGVGASSVKIDEQTYRNKLILHHYPESDPGRLWHVFGEEKSDPVPGLELLPSNTAFAVSGKCDLALLWNWVDKLISNSEQKDLYSAWMKLKRQARQSGFNLSRIADSMSGPITLGVTIDKDRTQPLPGPNDETLWVPVVYGMLAVKVEDNRLYEALKPIWSTHPDMTQQNLDSGELRSVPAPNDVDVQARPSIAKLEDYFIIASHPKAVTNALDARRNPDTRLTSSSEYRRLAKGLPKNGAGLLYFSPELSQTGHETLEKIIKIIKNTDSPASQSMVWKNMETFSPKNGFFCGIWQRGEEGVKMTSNSSWPGTKALSFATLIIGNSMLVAPAALFDTFVEGRRLD